MWENIIIAGINVIAIAVPAVFALIKSSASNKELKTENKNIKEQYEIASKKILKLEKLMELLPNGNVYYDKNGNAFCPVCYGNGKRMLLQKEIYEGEKLHICKSCDKEFDIA